MIKKIFLIISTIIVFVIIYGSYITFINPKSPKGTSSIEYKKNKLKVVYYRPYVNERLIFGEKADGALVPYDEYWRLGANFATVFSTNQSVSFAGENILPGNYRIYAIPYSNFWKIAINSDAGAFGFSEPYYEKDIYRINVPVSTLDKMIEQFTIDFVKDSIGVSLRMRWDKTKILIPIKTVVIKKILK